MIKEVKSISLGSGYDYISLDKYTNAKDSIKITFKDTGKELATWTLNDFGTIEIKRGVINHKDYEHPYRMEVVVEYEPSELPLTLADIDTLEGLKRSITDLKSLDYICNIRLVTNRKFKISLNEFVLFNSIVFDQFGQTWNLEYDKMEQYDYCTQDFIAIEEFKSRIKDFRMCGGHIPSADDTCPHCKQKWTLKDLRDCIGRGTKLYHKDCNKFNLYEKSKNEFNYIVSSIFEDYSLRAVKNEYGSESYNGYWFIVCTSDGDVKLGWRKRVIEITWLDNYKKFKFNGDGEDVTKKFSGCERYIHADSEQKAIEYLRKAKKSIID